MIDFSESQRRSRASAPEADGNRTELLSKNRQCELPRSSRALVPEAASHFVNYLRATHFVVSRISSDERAEFIL